MEVLVIYKLYVILYYTIFYVLYSLKYIIALLFDRLPVYCNEYTTDMWSCRKSMQQMYNHCPVSTSTLSVWLYIYKCTIIQCQWVYHGRHARTHPRTHPRTQVSKEPWIGNTIAGSWEDPRPATGVCPQYTHVNTHTDTPPILPHTKHYTLRISISPLSLCSCKSDVLVC